MKPNLKIISVPDFFTLSKNKKIVAYGANEFFCNLCDEFGIEKNVEFVIDNNNYIWETEQKFGNSSLKIFNPDVIKDLSFSEYVIVIFAPYYQMIYEQLNESNGKISIYAIISKADQISQKYSTKLKKDSLDNVILFRSGKTGLQRWDVSDNAKVFFDYLVDNGYNKKYKLVWIVHNVDEYQWLKSIQNVDVISIYWELTEVDELATKYYNYILNAKYCFFTDDCFFMRNRSKNQVLISLWHGCGFKARNSKTEPTGTHYDYMTVNSDLYAKIHAQIYGCNISQMLTLGLPKQDLLFSNKTIDRMEQIKRDGCRVVFWLPTFRSSEDNKISNRSYESQTGLPIVDDEKKLVELNKLLQMCKIVLFIKIHPSQRISDFNIPKLSNIFLLEDEEMRREHAQINLYLKYADALISDYSSAAVDYILLDRPIGFTVSDLSEYSNKRGFVFEDITEYLPGELLYSYEDLSTFLQNISEGSDKCIDKRHKLIPIFHNNCDKGVCRRIETFIFGGNDNEITGHK